MFLYEYRMFNESFTMRLKSMVTGGDFNEAMSRSWDLNLKQEFNNVMFSAEVMRSSTARVNQRHCKGVCQTAELRGRG